MSEREVYFARTKSSGAVKIGVSKEPEQRVKELQTGNPMEIEVILTTTPPEGHTALEWEQGLQKLCQSYKMNGEWFEEKVIHYLNGLLHGLGSEKKETFDPEEIGDGL